MFSVGLGIGQGYQPICGYNYGAGKYIRVRKAFQFTLIVGEVLMGIMALAGLLLSPLLIGWFRKDQEVIQIGTFALQAQCISLFFQPLSVMANMTFQSIGKRALATFCSMLRNGLYFIPMLLILVNTTGLFGIQTAQAFADILVFMTVLPLVIWFFKKLPKEELKH